MKVLMILFFLFIDNLAIGQYPFLPQNQQHYINGTVGEERGNRQRYHYGLDFAKAQNTKVYAIESGIFHIVNGSCTVGHFGYVHVTNHQKIEGDSVTIGIILEMSIAKYMFIFNKVVFCLTMSVVMKEVMVG